MSEILAQKKKRLEIMQMEFNVQKNEVRLLELDEEKEKVQETINEQKKRLEELKGGMD